MTELEHLVATSTRAETTKRYYLQRVRDFIQFAGESPADWTMEAVEAWRDHHLGRGLQPGTVSTYVNAVRYAAKRYARVHKVDDFCEGAENPVEIADAPRARNGKSEALTFEECEAMLATCARGDPPDLRDRAMILLGIHAGYRRQELCRLRIDNVRLADDGATATLAVIAKGRKWQEVDIGGEALEALQAWLGYLASFAATSGAVFRRLRPSAAPGAWALDEGLSDSGVYRILRGRAEAAGVASFHPHRMRHTFVTFARESGWQDWQIAKVTGHAAVLNRHQEIEVPMVDRYAHDRAGPLGARFPRFDAS